MAMVSFSLIRITILLSAPHAVKKVRNEVTKGEDRLTGGIVEYLCEVFQVFGIVRTGNLRDDPSYYNGSDYKEAILEVIKEYGIVYLFDIHGCTNDHGFDIGIGTFYGKNISHEIKEVEHIKNVLSKDFLV